MEQDGKVVGEIKILVQESGEYKVNSFCEKELPVETFVCLLLGYIKGLIETEEVVIKIKKD